MGCDWGTLDCENQDKKCHLCCTDKQFYYVTPKKNTYKKAKQNKRAGSLFEAKNSNANNDLLLGGSKPTPNSGAGQIKGDEQIVGLINIMEELKEQNTQNSRGSKTFTIHKDWLVKLKNEASAANMEFYYLKFAFGKEDVHNQETFVVIDSDMLMSMVKTLWEDRKNSRLATNQIIVAERRKELVEAENIYLKAKIAVLESGGSY